jgi:hypothetical protein
MRATQKRGGVLESGPALALPRGPSPRVTQRRHGLQSFGTPFQQVP